MCCACFALITNNNTRAQLVKCNKTSTNVISRNNCFRIALLKPYCSVYARAIAQFKFLLLSYCCNCSACVTIALLV